MTRAVRADWALIGKAAGSPDDYAILARSRGRTDLEALAWRYVVGVPSLRSAAEATSAAPWVMFGSHTTTDEPLLSLSVQTGTGHTDAAGRLIWMRGFYAFPYAETASAGASYGSLYHAAAQVGLSMEDGEPLSLKVKAEPFDDDSGLVAAVRGFGVERLAAIAASLLEGPVAVAGTASHPLRERLGLLDAIAAFLPYGLRADLPVSSAIDERISPTVRLVIADAPITGMRTVRLDDPPPVPATTLARDYLDLLLRKRSNAGEPELLRYLWSKTGPREFADPEAALRLLTEFDHVRDVRPRVTRHVDLQIVYEFFAEDPAVVAKAWAGLVVGQQGRLLGVLLANPGERTDQILVRSWPVLGPDVIEHAQRDLDQGDKSLAERIFVLIESRLPADDADGLLASLLLPPGGVAPPGPLPRPAIESRAALLGDRARVPLPEQYLHACSSLRFGRLGSWSPEIVRTLLTKELERGDGDRVSAWAAWLCESASPAEWRGNDPAWHRPAWMAALAHAVIHPAEEPSAEGLHALVKEDPAWVLLILWVAQVAGTVESVLGTLGRGLQDLIDRLLEFGQQWAESLAEVLAGPVRPAMLGMESLAIIDGALVRVGGAPVNFPGDAGKGEIDDYLKGLDTVLAHLAAPDKTSPSLAGRPRDQLVASAFLDHLLRFVKDEPLTRGAVSLVIAWSKQPARAPVLAGYIVRMKIGNDLLKYSELGVIWPELKEYSGIETFGAVGRLRAVAGDLMKSPEDHLSRQIVAVSEGAQSVEVTPIAMGIQDAYSAGMTADGILATLNGVWREEQGNDVLPLTPEELYDVLGECQAMLRNKRGEYNRRKKDEIQQYATEIIDEFSGLIIHGKAFGESFAREYAEKLNAIYAAREQYYRQRVGRLRYGGRAAKRWERDHKFPWGPSPQQNRATAKPDSGYDPHAGGH